MSWLNSTQSDTRTKYNPAQFLDELREKVLGGSEVHVLGDGEHNGVVVALAMRMGFGGSVDW